MLHVDFTSEKALVNSIVEAIYHHSVCHDKVCLIDRNTKLTYSELFKKSLQLAEVFTEMGLHEKDAFVFENTQDSSFFIVECAVHICGAVFVPVEKNATEEKILHVSKACKAKYIIAKKIGLSLEVLFEKAQAKGGLSGFPFPSPDSVSEILFTTGTTGKQKGVVLTHESSCTLAQNVIEGVGMKEDNVEMIPSPLNHSHGLRSCYANFYRGATVILQNGLLNLQKFFESIEQNGVTSMDLIPSALSLILKNSDNQLGAYKNQLRYVQFGAAPLLDADKEKLLDLLPDTRLYNFYGSTESGRIIVYDFNCSNPKKNCIGKPVSNARICILDDNLHEIDSSKDNTGVLASIGRMNMKCYLDDEQETAKVVKDGMFVTHDEVYIDSDGDIILLGRKDDIINSGGYKISPADVEENVLAINGIVDAICIAEPHERMGSVPAVLAVRSLGSELTQTDVLKILREKLEPFMIPHRVEFVESVERTYNGKLNRKFYKNYFTGEKS